MDEDLQYRLFTILFFCGALFGLYAFMTLLFWIIPVTLYHSDATLLQVIQGQYEGILKLTRQIV